MSQFDKHAATLDAAIEAVGSRRAWSAYADSPALHPSGPDGQIAGAAAFAAMLGRPAPLTQPGTLVTQTVEVSPYTGESLAIAYPRTDPGDLLARSLAGAQQWSRAAAEVRVGVCLEILERLYLRNFEFQAASVHTTGMSLGMAYTGNGTNALDRGLEALAHAHLAMSRVTPSATWERRFGTDSSTLTKRYSLMPRGVAVAIACASFPAWNTYPALMASLATGNPVIVKPHPSSVIMLAMAVQTCREVIEEAGFDPDLVTLAVDGPEAPIAVALVEDPRCGIVDFTGSPRFGGWLETHLPRTLVFTETAGVNPVVLDSVDDLARVTRTIAGGLCLFSAQMCTSPQNIYLPREGVRTATGQATYDEVVESLLEAIEAIVGAPRRAAALLGAIQAEATLAIQDDVTERVAARAGSGARRASGVPVGPDPEAHGRRGRDRRQRPVRRGAVRAQRVHRARGRLSHGTEPGGGNGEDSRRDRLLRLLHGRRLPRRGRRGVPGRRCQPHRQLGRADADELLRGLQRLSRQRAQPRWHGHADRRGLHRRAVPDRPEPSPDLRTGRISAPPDGASRSPERPPARHRGGRVRPAGRRCRHRVQVRRWTAQPARQRTSRRAGPW
jgi:phenylacetic acid degradation protein paaN